ncbi:hypothetical protein HanPI659440_Chr14g0526201 [Helianthus annuus]|nr:hypothetical protein HanPI659440_Chr14g0526201 [Helianthus annuus]
MKTLQEKVKTFEEQTSKRSNVESRRFEMVTVGGEISSSDENISCLSEQLPEIKARFICNDVLIRIHCEKKPSVVEKTLAEIEKLHLSVINRNAVIFANSVLHITVLAQMDKDLTMTAKDFIDAGKGTNCTMHEHRLAENGGAGLATAPSLASSDSGWDTSIDY